MRRLVRLPLDPDLVDYLSQMQARIDSGADPRATWKAQRQRASMRRVAETLARMTGPRQRCMFCQDSRGTDIEHFRPLSVYPDYVFVWLNFLWICAACNRCKGSRFPCDPAGNPLLIDPTLEEPWEFLFFDSDTGQITARWDSATGEESPKGIALLEIFSSLRHQAVTEGRRRTFLHLRRAVRSFLDLARSGVASEAALQDLLEGVDDASDYGISIWYFLQDGQDEEHFRTLRTRFPTIWDAIVDRLRV